jgi:signal transduction histidine kinase
LAKAEARERDGERELVASTPSPDELAAAFETFSRASVSLEKAHEVLRVQVEELTRRLRDTEDRLRESLEENDRLSELAARRSRLEAMGRMAAEIAHEIRNPLTVLRGASSRLQKLEQLPVPERKELLGMLDEEVARMGAVVQNFLDLSRRPDSEASTFPLRPVLERTMEILNVELNRCGVRSAIRWEAENGVEIRGRPQALHHLFLNLALNARDAMPEGGELTILVQTRKSELRIYFQDSGPGIPRPLRSKIFEPFFTTRAEGTGLGLAFVERIVSEHGGTITVGSSPSGGAQFQIFLPIET